MARCPGKAQFGQKSPLRAMDARAVKAVLEKDLTSALQDLLAFGARFGAGLGLGW